MTYHLYRPARVSRPIRVWITLGLLLSCAAITSAGYRLATAESPPVELPASSVIINEIRSGKGDTTDLPVQFVSLYNASDSEISLTGWKLEFVKQPFGAEQCTSLAWDKPGELSAYSLFLSGSVKPRQLSQAFDKLTISDNLPGAVHLVDANSVIQDTVGWGSGSNPAPCFETAQASHLIAGNSLQRYVGCLSHMPIDTDDNLSDFRINTTPSPGQVGTVIAPQCNPTTEDPEIPDPTPDPTPEPSPDPSTSPVTPVPYPSPSPSPAPSPDAQADCNGVVISEILPNPAGTDTGHEFIELYNPTNQAIALDGCSLQTSASSTKSYTFGSLSLQPEQFQAFSDATTALTLPNASGGSVWLLNAAEELQKVDYPADPDDDVSWAFADGSWGLSYTVTPGTYNAITPLKPCEAGQVRNAATSRCVSVALSADGEDSGSTLVPCIAGQVRNPETNRCRATTATGESLAACPVGQVRNADTNRCRSATAAVAASTATACKAGQERNADTNRCRAVGTSATASKACPAGQECNAETNRCRKISPAGVNADGSGLNGVKDIAAAGTSKAKPYWLIAGLALIAAVGYGIYEWRQEISLFFARRFGSLRLARQAAGR